MEKAPILQHALRRLLFLFILSLGLAAASVVLGDVVHLKNGGRLEGIIKEEGETSVILEVGAGSVSIRRKQIARIERADPTERKDIEQAWRRELFLHDKYVPKGMVSLARKYRAVAGSRASAIQARKRLTQVDVTRKAQKGELLALRKAFVKHSRVLEGSKPSDDVAGYNRLVVRVNRLRQQMLLKQADIAEQDGIEGASRKTLSSYLSSFVAFQNEFGKARTIYEGGARDKDRDYFFRKIGESLSAYDREVVTIEVTPTSAGGGKLLWVTINGTHRGRFLLDTGAARMMLSRRFAQKLGLNLEGGTPLNVVLADGSRQPAQAVVLSRVDVQGAVVENVDAVVLPMRDQTFDGLCGMSYLKHFLVGLDGGTGKLTLKHFAPGS